MRRIIISIFTISDCIFGATQTRHPAQWSIALGTQIASDDRNGMAQFGCTTEPRLDSLHVACARAACVAIPSPITANTDVIIQVRGHTDHAAADPIVVERQVSWCPTAPINLVVIRTNWTHRCSITLYFWYIYIIYLALSVEANSNSEYLCFLLFNWMNEK